ncbi:uncharacterized protein mRpL50 [Planococcus citri]|uniref:uncharacterized protein mRpL50 n=1 Tax=Planococcus citri TaxID=170843 RepID=UPI0031FA2E4D
MAAYIGHVLSTAGSNFSKILWNSSKILTVPVRSKSGCTKKVKKNPKNYIRKAGFQPKVDSLQSRGFLRNLPPYNPPQGVTNEIREIFNEVVGTSELSHQLDTDQKYKLLVKCSDTFGHSVPNSNLYKMKTLGDVFEFYHTPCTNVTPYENLKDMDLPPNLHIIQDYMRFHPDTDTMFGGVTAFPKSSTMVTGLNYKKKYKGHTQESPWGDI